MKTNIEDHRMLGALLRIPFQVIVARIYDGLQARGYTDLRPAHFVVFQLLKPEGSNVTVLAEAAQMTKQSMGALVAHLEACGYVESLQDQSDKRAKIISLTMRGQALDKAAREILGQIEREWAEKLGGERLEELKITLRELADLIS